MQKVLIVEDERIIAEDIRKSVIACGYDVSGVLSKGEEAIDFPQNHPVDLVLMDIMLKGEMDGIEAADIIFHKYNIPFVYLTAFTNESLLNKAKKTRSYGYIVKPFQEMNLKVVLEMAFSKFNYDNELKKNEKRFRKLIEDNRDGIIVVNKNGEIRFANNAAVSLFERKKEDLINKNIGFPISNDEFTELNIIGKSNNKRIVEMHIVETEWEKEKAYLASLRDITNRKRIERELIESNKKLHDLIGEIVKGLMSTIEMRDPYTSGHQRRVADLASTIAEEMNLSKEKIEGIRLAALIHDIGKIRIPSEILSKPGKLTPLEFELIKSHAKDGYNILNEIEFPWPVAQIVLQHHERLNGSGYPNYLKDNDIILEARILCVADVVEAMCSHRPYRPALGMKKAIDEIFQKKNILYDDNVVNACMKVINVKGFSFDL